MNHWIKETATVEALKYNTKKDFFLFNRSAYSFAYKHGFLNEICFHMIKLGNLKQKCVYVYEFSDLSVYVGITNNFNRRRTDRENRSFDTVTKYISKTGLIPVHKQITDYIPIEETVRLEEEYVNKYRSDGWNILNRLKTGGIGGDTLMWTYEKVMEESKKYTTRSDFNLHSKGAYDAARRNGWLSEAHAHMIEMHKPKGYWTRESCIEEAKKYVTRQDFQKYGGGAYSTASKNKWLQECCKYI